MRQVTLPGTVLTVPWYILMAKYYNSFIHFIIISSFKGGLSFLRHEYICIYILLLIIHVYKCPAQLCRNMLGVSRHVNLYTYGRRLRAAQRTTTGWRFACLFRKKESKPMHTITIGVSMTGVFKCKNLISSGSAQPPLGCCRSFGCWPEPLALIAHILLQGPDLPVHNRAGNTTAANT